ncbi:MAG: hypothetical protein R3B72_24280 [Polyangiaceae bacterium]
MTSAILRFRSLIAVVVATIMAALGACTSGDESAGAGASGTGTNTGPESVGGSGHADDGVTLSVVNAESPLSVNGTPPKPGTQFFQVRVLLSNESPTETASMAFLNFRLVTADSIEYTASLLSASLPSPCREDVLVAQGGTAECDVLFEPDQGSVPTSLRYEYMGLSATAEVTGVLPPPGACNVIEAFDQSNDPNACLSCADNLCGPQYQAYLTSLIEGYAPDLLCGYCYSECVGANDPSCTCHADCNFTPECEAVFEDFASCLSAQCSTQCNL